MTYYHNLVATWHADPDGKLYCVWIPIDDVLDKYDDEYYAYSKDEVRYHGHNH